MLFWVEFLLSSGLLCNTGEQFPDPYQSTSQGASSPLSAPSKRNNENPKADSEASAGTPSPENGSRGGKEGQSSPFWEHNNPRVGYCKQEGCGQDLSAAAALLTASVPTGFDLRACGVLCHEINTLLEWGLFALHISP